MPALCPAVVGSREGSRACPARMSSAPGGSECKPDDWGNRMAQCNSAQTSGDVREFPIIADARETLGGTDRGAGSASVVEL